MHWAQGLTECGFKQSTDNVGILVYYLITTPNAVFSYTYTHKMYNYESIYNPNKKLYTHTKAQMMCFCCQKHQPLFHFYLNLNTSKRSQRRVMDRYGPDRFTKCCFTHSEREFVTSKHNPNILNVLF